MQKINEHSKKYLTKPKKKQKNLIHIKPNWDKNRQVMKKNQKNQKTKLDL